VQAQLRNLHCGSSSEDQAKIPLLESSEYLKYLDDTSKERDRRCLILTVVRSCMVELLVKLVTESEKILIMNGLETLFDQGFCSFGPNSYCR
jgi:hypothetical protein